MEPHIVAIIQARMGSTRLPGKSMKKICGKPIIELLIERLKQSKKINRIVIATTTHKRDMPLVELAKRLGVDYFQGPEDDVMGRFYEAAKKFKADIFLRITGDNILMDPYTIDKMLELHTEDADYTHINGLSFVAPEIVTFKAFERAVKLTNNSYDREHVTPIFRLRTDLFSVTRLEPTFNRLRWDFRLTIDTQQDFDLLNEIHTKLYKSGETIKLKDVYKLLDEHPKLLELNKQIKQKKFEY